MKSIAVKIKEAQELMYRLPREVSEETGCSIPIAKKALEACHWHKDIAKTWLQASRIGRIEYERLAEKKEKLLGESDET